MPNSATFKRAQAHAASVQTISDGSQSPDKPSYRSLSYRVQIEDVLFVRTVDGGTKLMRAAGTTHLPQFEAEENPDYDRRLAMAVLFNAYARTLDGLNGMVHRKDPKTDVPPIIEEHLENIDLAGRDLPTFSRDVNRNAMNDGHTWIHVEHPKLRPTISNRRDERAAGLRPYWLNVLKADAINWAYTMLDGRPVLDLFVYLEAVTEPEGTFGEKTIQRIRVLRPGLFEVWQLEGEDDKASWVNVDNGTGPADIPIVPVYGQRTGHFTSVPALLDLAYENVEHWQVRSDHRHALQFASNPMPVFTGADHSQIVWGANRALFITEPSATAQILESSGTSLAASDMELTRIEARMAALGLAMLVRESNAAETVQGKMLDKSEKDSQLSVMAVSLQRGLNSALAIHGEYLKLDAGTITINRDFNNLQMDAAVAQLLSDMELKGQIPRRTMWKQLVAGEILPDEFDADAAEAELEARAAEGFEFGPPAPVPGGTAA